MAKEHLVKKNLTILGAETEFSGDLSFKDNLVISGNFNGTISASGNIEISKEAVCIVDSISANSVTVFGKVKGNVSANQFVEMHSGCQIQGNINTSKIYIEDGVDFQGKISMIENPQNSDLFAMSSSEYRDSLALYRGVDNQ